MRDVLYVSGSRADYGPAREVLQSIQTSPRLRLSILVTGMHLDPLHGETWREIAADGFIIAARVPGRLACDSLAAMAGSVGLYLYGMSEAIERIRPDIVLVLGDRGEQLAAAMAAAFQNTVVVHLCGGSLSGSIDDSIRHAITKFAHYHLPACEEHAQRIIQMGEDPATVRVVGLPGGDIRPDATLSRSAVCAELGIPGGRPYVLVVQHSVSQSHHAARGQIIETLEAVAALGHHTLLADPNDDAGGRAILAEMRAYSARYPHLHILPATGSRERFASIMAHAGVLVGNSSCSIAEAMSAGLPAVNIGDRQRGREHLACLLNVGYDRAEIARAIQLALEDHEYRKSVAEFVSPLIRDTPRAVTNVLENLDLSVPTHPKAFVDLVREATPEPRPGGKQSASESGFLRTSSGP